MLLGEQIKPEMIQSMIEVGTGICRNIQEARADITRLRSHHFGPGKKEWTWQSSPPQRIRSRAGRTRRSLTTNAMNCSCRSCKRSRGRLLIFGLHVHVGMADRERAIHIMNAARYFLPHVLALSTSSPFWMGHNTGLKSYRTEIFKQFPRTDIPDHFDSYSRISALRRSAGQDGLHRQRQEDLVGHSPASIFPDTGVSRL